MLKGNIQPSNLIIYPVLPYNELCCRLALCKSTELLMAHIEARTNKNGKTRYRVQIRLKGKPTQSATFERKTDARKWAQDTESAIRDGRHFKTVESKRHTVGEMLDRYIKSVLPKKGKNQFNQKPQLEWWKDKIGNYLLADASPSLIAEHRDLLQEEKTHLGTTRSPSTANRYLAALSHCFTIATNEWGWLDDSPMRKVRKCREPRGRVRYLSDDERKRLLQACQEVENQNLYPVVVLALSTGARQSEILTLTWKQVNLTRGQITLYETKNDEIRSIPLVGFAHNIVRNLSQVRRLDTELLFPGKRNKQSPTTIRNAWEHALILAEIEDFRFHDLRHSAASYLAMSGATLAEIADILGHKTLQMVKRYAHLSDSHSSKVVTKMNENIFN